MPFKIIITILTFLSVFQILQINGQVDYCNVIECKNGTGCQPVKAKTAIALRCDEYKPILWTRTKDNVSIANTTSVSTTINDNYYIERNCDSFPFIYVIQSLSELDEGENSHIIKIAKTETEICKFSLHIFDDIVYGFLNIENNAFPINQTAPINHTIDSFKQNFEYDFNIEHLPLESISANKVTLENAKQCDENSTIHPWLRCLQSEKIYTKLETCQNILSLSFSYSFNKNKYPNITAKTFNHSIDFFYPPKVINEQKKEFYNESNETLSFTCDYPKCGNPTTFTFQWFDSNDIELSTPSSDNKFEYKGPKNDSFVIYCEVTNGIRYTNPSFINESRTYFMIAKKPIDPIEISTTESSTASTLNSTLSSNQTTVIDPVPSGLKDWEIAVIVVNCVLALVIIGGLLFYILVFRRKSTEKKDLNTTNIYDNTSPNMNSNAPTFRQSDINENSDNPVTSLSMRQADLNDNLVENPVYGKSRNGSSRIDDIEQDETGSTRSDNIREKNNQTLV